jgi:hypothetical protein
MVVFKDMIHYSSLSDSHEILRWSVPRASTSVQNYTDLLSTGIFPCESSNEFIILYLLWYQNRAYTFRASAC